jgi:hypothetical protein
MRRHDGGAGCGACGRKGTLLPNSSGSGTPLGRHYDRSARSSLDWDRRRLTAAKATSQETRPGAELRPLGCNESRDGAPRGAVFIKTRRSARRPPHGRGGMRRGNTGLPGARSKNTGDDACSLHPSPERGGWLRAKACSRVGFALHITTVSPYPPPSAAALPHNGGGIRGGYTAGASAALASARMRSTMERKPFERCGVRFSRKPMRSNSASASVSRISRACLPE